MLVDEQKAWEIAKKIACETHGQEFIVFRNESMTQVTIDDYVFDLITSGGPCGADRIDAYCVKCEQEARK